MNMEILQNCLVIESKKMRSALIIPVYNAMPYLRDFIEGLEKQVIKPDEILFIDSSSSDGTASFLSKEGYSVLAIDKQRFNHGGTRRMATEIVHADLYIMITQDAFLNDEDSIKNIITPFLEDIRIGSVYGRQLPHVNASYLAAFAREYNYPSASITKTMNDAKAMGIKACYSSDSFAAYRKIALDDVGGFPENVIGTEDTYVTAKMMIKGWKHRYEASATVRHSHDYTLLEQLKRYFDIGVFYGDENWIGQNFGSAGGEGFNFVKNELEYLIKRKKYTLIPYSIIANFMKIAGYKLGMNHKFLSQGLKRKISMFPPYWS